MKTRIFSIAVTFVLGAFSIAAQTSGAYDLSHNTLAGGGEMQSAGDRFRVDGTVGQRLAGSVSTGSQFSLHGGFWFRNQLAPTAAQVTIGGRVNNTRGGVVRRVRITLTEAASGTVKTTLTNQFGYYRFEGVEVGRIYIVRAESRNFTFTPEMHVFSLVDERLDLDFTAVGNQP